MKPLLALCLVLACLTGCTAQLPTYPAMSDREALDTIAARLDGVRTLWSECDLSLRSAAGDSVSLDGAIAASRPASFRLRAWKFGRAVLDVTSVGDQTWVMAPEPRGERSTTALPTGALAHGLALPDGSFFRDARTIASPGPRWTVAGADGVVCEIDRRTLTPRRLTFAAQPGTEVLLDRYRLIDGVAWPMSINLRGDQGSVSIRLRDPELNGDLPPGAFSPPARAVLQP